MDPYVHTEIDQSLATITFFHPSSNSFPSVQLQKLVKAISDLEEHENVSVILLKSAGEKAFCAGASFDELLAVKDEENGLAFFSGFAHVINAMRKSSKLIIGRIQGKTVGGGVGIAAACDYTFAHSNSAIKLSELAIGIGPFVIEPAVSRKIGLPAMSEMTLNPIEWKSAQWAFENKLFTQLFDDVEEMDVAIKAFAQQLSSYNPMALKEMKRVFWSGTEHWDQLLTERAKISGRLVLSDFTIDALTQFKTK